jgi:hypothetical protein
MVYERRRDCHRDLSRRFENCRCRRSGPEPASPSRLWICSGHPGRRRLLRQKDDFPAARASREMFQALNALRLRRQTLRQGIERIEIGVSLFAHDGLSSGRQPVECRPEAGPRQMPSTIPAHRITRKFMPAVGPQSPIRGPLRVRRDSFGVNLLCQDTTRE